MSTDDQASNIRKADDISASPLRPLRKSTPEDMDVDASDPTPPPSSRSQQKSKTPRTLTAMWSSARTSSATRLSSLGKTRSSLSKSATPSGNRAHFADDSINPSNRTNTVGNSTPTNTSTTNTNDNPINTTPTSNHLNNVAIRLSTSRFATPTSTTTTTQVHPGNSSQSNLPTIDNTETITTASTTTGSSSASAGRTLNNQATPTPTRTIPKSWDHIMIMECWIRVPKATGSPFTTFRDRLFSALDFLHIHGEDPTIAFLPKDTDDSRNKPPMLLSADFPLVQCNAKRHYLSMDNAFAFSTVNNAKGRRISFSVRMGFNVDPDLFLADMASDLDERHASFKRKTQQSMDVGNAVVLWGAPQFMCPRDGKAIIDSYLIPLEKEMMKEDPSSFPAAIHGAPWPDYELVLEQPADFDRTPPGEQYVPKPLRRRAVHIKCAKTDIPRFTILVAVAKGRRIWLDEFAKCFPSEVISKRVYEEDEANYDEVVNAHMAAQFSYAKSYVPGLLQARVDFKVQCLPDAQGNIATHTVSIRSILQDVEFAGKKVFQCVLRSDGNRRYQVYYKAKCPLTLAFVRQYMQCPAAQIYYYLLKRGVKRTEADRVVRKSFSHTQVAQVHPAKYNKATKLAYVTVAEEDMDIVTAAQQADSFIDIYAHLTPAEADAKKAQQAALLRAASDTDPAAYDFDNGQDVTSIHAGVHHPQLGSGASIGASKYSVVTDANGLQLDNELEGDVPQVTGVTFAMEREDGTIDDVLRLPETNHPGNNDDVEDDVTSKADSDIHMQDASLDKDDKEEDENEDDEIEHTLVYMLCVAAPDDIVTIDTMLDQFEAEQFDTTDTAETAPGMRARVTDAMRSALITEAQEARMSILEYIHDLRCSLYRSHGKGGGSDDEDNFFSDEEVDEIEDESFKLQDEPTPAATKSPAAPALADGLEQEKSPDSTGLPQGSGSTTHMSTALQSATLVAAGHEADTARLGGSPG